MSVNVIFLSLLLFTSIVNIEADKDDLDKSQEDVICPLASSFDFHNCQDVEDMIDCGEFEQSITKYKSSRTVDLKVVTHKPPSEIDVVYCHKFELETTCETDWLWRSKVTNSHKIIQISERECKLTKKDLIQYPEPSCEWNSYKHTFGEHIEGVRAKAKIDPGSAQVLLPRFDTPCSLDQGICHSSDFKSIIIFDTKSVDKQNYVEEVTFSILGSYNQIRKVYHELYGMFDLYDLKQVTFMGEPYVQTKTGLLINFMHAIGESTKALNTDSYKNPEDVHKRLILHAIERRTKNKMCILAARTFLDLKKNNLIDLDLIQFFEPLEIGNTYVIMGNGSIVLQCKLHLQNIHFANCNSELSKLYKLSNLTVTPFGYFYEGKLCKYDHHVPNLGQILPKDRNQKLNLNSDLYDLHKRFNYTSHEKLTNDKMTKKVEKSNMLNFADEIQFQWNRVTNLWADTKRYIYYFLIVIIFLICAFISKEIIDTFLLYRKSKNNNKSKKDIVVKYVKSNELNKKSHLMEDAIEFEDDE